MFVCRILNKMFALNSQSWLQLPLTFGRSWNVNSTSWWRKMQICLLTNTHTHTHPAQKKKGKKWKTTIKLTTDQELCTPVWRKVVFWVSIGKRASFGYYSGRFMTVVLMFFLLIFFFSLLLLGFLCIFCVWHWKYRLDKYWHCISVSACVKLQVYL